MYLIADQEAFWGTLTAFQDTFTAPMVERPFPLNAWYAVAWRHELRKGEILGRTVCGAHCLRSRQCGKLQPRGQ
jgi:phenylpropionate dioxygenase-like ring-hydroxylating dioxygenase large terminal subunit